MLEHPFLQTQKMTALADVLSAIVVALHSVSLVIVVFQLISRKLTHLDLWWDDRISTLAFVWLWQSAWAVQSSPFQMNQDRTPLYRHNCFYHQEEDVSEPSISLRAGGSSVG